MRRLIKVYSICQQSRNFYAPPHDSVGVLWYHLRRPCVCPFVHLSVVRPSVFCFRMVTCQLYPASVRPAVRTSVCSVTPWLLEHLSWNLKTFTGDSPMDEDWRNALNFGILMCAGICDGAPSTFSSLRFNSLLCHQVTELIISCVFVLFLYSSSSSSSYYYYLLI